MQNNPDGCHPLSTLVFKSSSSSAWARICCSLRLHIYHTPRSTATAILSSNWSGRPKRPAKRVDVSISDTSVYVVETLGWRRIAALLEMTGHRSGSNQPTGSSFHRSATRLQPASATCWRWRTMRRAESGGGARLCSASAPHRPNLPARAVPSPPRTTLRHNDRRRNVLQQ